MDDHFVLNKQLKRFWIIKGALIFCFAIACVWTGYFFGSYKMNLKIQGATMAARSLLLKEHSAVGRSYQLITSGMPFCYNQGNVYPAKIVPVKNRSLMPWFKTVQAEEF